MAKVTKKKKRLHFGVVLPSLDNTHKYCLLDGINDFAQKNDIHLTAYFGTYEANNYDFASHYEPCFEAIINSTTLDGILVYSGFIAHNIGTEEFIAYINSVPKHIPVVSIGMPLPGVYSVVVDNKQGMYNAVDHLIKQHGKKRLAVITGPKGHPEADARLEGYKQALTDNGLTIEDDLILPGSFTPMSGRDATSKLLENRNVEYDSISACDDEAAFGAITVLRANGIAVPDDISVTGFDDVDEASTYNPPLSTVRQDFSLFGVIAGEMLCKIVAGEPTDKENHVVPAFVQRRSCGCPVSKRPAGKEKRVISREVALRHRRVTDNLLLQFNLDSLTNELQKSLPFISINSILVGLYHNPVEGNFSEGDRAVETLFGFDGEQKFNTKILSSNAHIFSNYTSIDSFDFDRVRRTLFFLPLFFADEESGTALIAYDDDNAVDSYETLRRNIATAVKGASLLDKIRTLSITDELTGLLNRRGFFQFVYSRILLLQRGTDLVPIVLALDMDGLKSINDTYGHAEGDVAIQAFAKTLKDVMREEDIIGRIGGDEFVVFSLIKSTDNIDKLVERIRTKFDEYNTKGLHKFKVLGSIGAVVLHEKTNAGFDQAMLDADDILYEEKVKKKDKGLSRQ